MFLLRSAFWLTVAFVTLHPRDVDLGAAASALSDRAMAAGQQMLADQILKTECMPIRCTAATTKVRPAAVTASLSAPSAGPTMQGSPNSRPAPVPRPRPDWMG
jgi:hypothetical protein